MVGVQDVIGAVDFPTYITPMLVYIAGIVIYAMIIWKGYRYISKRDLFTLHWEKLSNARHKRATKTWLLTTHGLKYLIIFPLITFLWFGVLAVLVIFMAKSQPISVILLGAMTIVVATRVLGYYQEELAREVAKLLPLAMLALFIVDPTYFSLEVSLNQLAAMPSYWVTLLNYLLFAVLLEIALRLVMD